MTLALVYTCVRVRDIDASVRFYELLGFERRGKLDFGQAYNIYMGLPGDGDRLELTVNVGREEPYDLGDGYNHVAIAVDDLDGVLAGLADLRSEVPADRPRLPAHPEQHPGHDAAGDEHRDALEQRLAVALELPEDREEDRAGDRAREQRRGDAEPHRTAVAVGLPDLVEEREDQAADQAGLESLAQDDEEGAH